MIIRRVGTDLLLIAQDDHAALAGRIMTAWRADGLPTHPRRDRVLQATAEHDFGWQPVDAAPSIDPTTGTPYEFVTAPLEIRQGVWTHALDHLAPQDPYVAALVAHHARAVYRRYESTPGWETFFSSMDRRRDDLLAIEGLPLDTLLQDYPCVGMGDLWSLVFCTGSGEPCDREHYHAALHTGGSWESAVTDAIPQDQADGSTVNGGWLEITPDPFDGEAVPFAVSAIRVPDRRYASDQDLRDTIAHAPTARLAGVAAGIRPF